VVVIETVARRVVFVLDVVGEGVCGANGVFTGDDGDGGGVVVAGVDALGNDGGDELENVGADGASDEVAGGDLLDHVGFVGLGVDGSVIRNGGFGVALGADLDDFVGFVLLQLLDDTVHHIAEDNFVTRVVQAGWGVSWNSNPVDGMLGRGARMTYNSATNPRPMLPAPK